MKITNHHYYYYYYYFYYYCYYYCYYYYYYYRPNTNGVFNIFSDGGLVIWARSRVRARTICCCSALRCRHFWSWP